MIKLESGNEQNLQLKGIHCQTKTAKVKMIMKTSHSGDCSSQLWSSEASVAVSLQA